MDLPVDKFIEGLFSDEAASELPDKTKAEVDAMDYPPWFDRKKFEQGQRFFRDHYFALTFTAYYGLLGLLSLPSVLRVFVSTRRSSSQFTAYKRYMATMYHMHAWFDYELKPGTVSWRSLHDVRGRHYRTNLSSQTRKSGIVSQRDLSLTTAILIGFGILKPSKLGLRALQPGDWDAYMHVWKTIGYMVGIEDRYNTCRQTEEETRQVLQIVMERVYTPCLENVPENFEHMSRMVIEALWAVNPLSDTSALFYTRYLANVPGYVLTEEDRLEFCNELRQQLKGKPLDTGVDSKSLMAASVSGLPTLPPRIHFLRDYERLDTVPVYRNLTTYERFKLHLTHIVFIIANTYIGRILINLFFRYVMILSYYVPYIAWFRYGFREAYVKMFKDGPMDNTKPKLNAEIYEERERRRNMPWLKCLWNSAY